jgi:hypothetical protein
LSAWTWSFFAVILEKGHPSTRTFLLVGRDFTTNVPRIRSSLQSKKITEAERTLHPGSRGGRPGRRLPALIPCLPRLPRLISARVELAHMQLTVAQAEPAHTHLTLHLPSSPWLGRNLSVRISQRPRWNSPTVAELSEIARFRRHLSSTRH